MAGTLSSQQSTQRAAPTGAGSLTPYVSSQVQAKALSVLDAILKSSENEFYKRYYYERRDILEGLCRARKDMLRTRAEKVCEKAHAMNEDERQI